MRERLLRVVALGALVLWCATAVLPAYTACFNYSVELPMPGPIMGWHALLFGWLGPMGVEGYVGDVPGREYPPTCRALLPALDLGRYRETSTASWGWFANPLWWRCIYLMVKGRGVPALSATAAALLALLALQPLSTWFDHPIAAYTPAIGAYLWTVAIATPLALLIGTQLAWRGPASISQRSNPNRLLHPKSKPAK